MRTYSATASDAEASREWYVVDATGQTLGRLATQIATVLKGKHKPIYTPSMDCGDFVIVINADKVQVTGRKLDQKIYYRFSGYPGRLEGDQPARSIGHPSRAGDRGSGQGHVESQPPAPPVDQEAQGIRRAGASAFGPAAQAFPVA